MRDMSSPQELAINFRSTTFRFETGEVAATKFNCILQYQLVFASQKVFVSECYLSDMLPLVLEHVVKRPLMVADLAGVDVKGSPEGGVGKEMVQP